MSEKEYVGTGKGLGYYGSSDIYEDNQKVGSEAYRTTLSGRTYVDEYDKDGNKIGSHYTDD
ncbi:hypothetical protein [Caproiciproducens faecalis]|uniref:YD repeat-containing protein n=1 Tax=Caproiciproducens faecalis TaxID=2820301 RepID=A0ABS7DLL0_9FIRM|nr:hypothetical protein [Caproiciproducens faecalis]MBW7571971.1 hypothetical protein [Caproiciproducens faecalis]